MYTHMAKTKAEFIFEDARLELQGASRSYNALAGKRNATKQERKRALERLERAREDFERITSEDPSGWEGLYKRR